MSLYFSVLLFLVNIRTGISLPSEIEMTINIAAGTEECFYQEASKEETIDIDYQVISGGQGKLDIGFRMTAPSGLRMVYDAKESDNGYSFVAPEDGAYELCWVNTFSHFNAKIVFFELVIGLGTDLEDTTDSDTAEWTESFDENDEYELYNMKIGDIQASVERVHVLLNKVHQFQEMQRAYEARDRITAEKNLNYVNMWAQAQIILMLAVGFVQVMLLRSLFEIKPSSLWTRGLQRAGAW